jgi:hypothetical protein
MLPINRELKFSLVPRGKVAIQLTLPADGCALVVRNDEFYFYGQKFSAIGPLNDEQINQLLDLGVQLKVDNRDL